MHFCLRNRLLLGVEKPIDDDGFLLDRLRPTHCLTLERFFGCVLQTLDVDLIYLHYILCFLQCWIRRNCSLKPFWLAQNGAPAPDFFHHLAGVFLEMAPVAIGELARFHIEETE